MSRVSPNYLLVEGKEDKMVIPYVMEAFIPWPDSAEERPVTIEEFGGIGPLLQPGVIEAKIKTSGLRALGIMIDADDDPQRRWNLVRDRCVKAFPEFPESMPSTGLIVANEEGLKLGVWVMPDNQTRGMLETFLAYFVPTESESLWAYSSECCAESRAAYNAPYKKAHFDKAKIHTWLAWQDPPGCQLHTALLTKALKPGSPSADSFVLWFRTLYSV